MREGGRERGKRGERNREGEAGGGGERERHKQRHRESPLSKGSECMATEDIHVVHSELRLNVLLEEGRDEKKGREGGGQRGGGGEKARHKHKGQRHREL